MISYFFWMQNMETKICSRIHRINYLNGEDCLLSDIYKQSGVSKQTVNSAIRSLERPSLTMISFGMVICDF